MLGLWLTTYTQSQIVTAADPSPLGSLTLTDYKVTDLRPAPEGYMFRRGVPMPPA